MKINIKSTVRRSKVGNKEKIDSILDFEEIVTEAINSIEKNETNEILHKKANKLLKEMKNYQDQEKTETMDFIKFLIEKKEDLIRLIDSEKNTTFRQSRELIDNKLTRKPIESAQLSLFDNIDEKEKKIANPNHDQSAQPIIKGLDLSPAEDRLVHTLSLLISKHSEKRNQDSPEYYMGNQERGVTTLNSIELETARLMISPHELYSNYLGRDDYNTDHIQFILQSLNNLSKKNFLVSLTIPKGTGQKGKRFDKLRTYLPLFQVVILNKDLTETESQEIENNQLLVEGKRGKFLFRFNPIFTNSIRERYVEFPEDIHLRIARSSGKKGRVSQCTNLMRDFLFREKQQKRYTVVRDEETLFRILNLEKMRKEGRKKKVNEMLQKSFDIFLKIELLKDIQKSLGKKGQVQYTMEINPDFK